MKMLFVTLFYFYLLLQGTEAQLDKEDLFDTEEDLFDPDDVITTRKPGNLFDPANQVRYINFIFIFF